ncbi:hypothetical protein D3C71_1523610 [compost metagenome]
MGIHVQRLISGDGIARRVFASHGDRPGAVRQCLRISRRNVNAPCTVRAHFSGVGLTVQRDGQVGALREMFAAAGQGKSCGLLAGIDDVISGSGAQRHAGIGGDHIHGDAARRSRFAAVDLHYRPGVFAVGLRRQFYRPGAIGADHRAGDGVAAAVLDLNGRARLAGAAKGRGVIVRDLFCTQHTLLVTLFIRHEEGRRRAFDLFGVVDDFGFGVTITAVRQQRANRPAA